MAILAATITTMPDLESASDRYCLRQSFPEVFELPRRSSRPKSVWKIAKVNNLPRKPNLTRAPAPEP
jgi:hypothetical protein